MFIPWMLAAAETNEHRDASYLAAVSVTAILAVGAYNLYLKDVDDADSTRIFRDNLLLLNAIPLLTWGVGQLAGWSSEITHPDPAQ